MAYSDEVITRNEVMNDGKTVHLYFNKMYQEYVAYGISAYIIAHTIPTQFPTYSDDMQMPMVAVDKNNISQLKKNLEVVSFNEDEYYQLKSKKELDEDDYERWANMVRG